MSNQIQVYAEDESNWTMNLFSRNVGREANYTRERLILTSMRTAVKTLGEGLTLAHSERQHDVPQVSVRLLNDVRNDWSKWSTVTSCMWNGQLLWQTEGMGLTLSEVPCRRAVRGRSLTPGFPYEFSWDLHAWVSSRGCCLLLNHLFSLLTCCCVSPPVVEPTQLEENTMMNFIHWWT